MAKSYNQKGKILYLERILQGTGENHTVSMQEILDELTEQGISAERKSIYDDMEVPQLSKNEYTKILNECTKYMKESYELKYKAIQTRKIRRLLFGRKSKRADISKRTGNRGRAVCSKRAKRS